MTNVHPSATLSDKVELGQNVHIGPRCTLEGRVRLGDGVRLIGDVYLHGPVTIGADTIVYPYACIGFPAQDVKFKLGDPTPGVVIGTNGIIREHATVHAATHQELPTTVGDRAFIMVNAHVGHDAQIGNDVTLVNNAAVAGHVQIADRAIMSGNSCIHQFCRIGRLALISGSVACSCDVMPFAICEIRNHVSSPNIIGMRRAGYSNEDITKVRLAFGRALLRNIPRAEVLQILDELALESAAVAELAEFVRTAKRAIVRGHRPAKDEEHSDAAVSS